jgi:hypothetical protein
VGGGRAGGPARRGGQYQELADWAKTVGGNPLYGKRNMLFYKAIKVRYPEIQIASNARRIGNEEGCFQQPSP